VLQAKLHSAESVTLELFRTALKLADNKGVLKGTGRVVHERRKAFAENLRGIIDDLDTLSRMQRVHQ
jgi:glycerol-3-phosphate O-acyltransferase